MALRAGVDWLEAGTNQLFWLEGLHGKFGKLARSFFHIPIVYRSIKQWTEDIWKAENDGQGKVPTHVVVMAQRAMRKRSRWSYKQGGIG